MNAPPARVPARVAWLRFGVTAAWLAMVLLGLGHLLDYATTPGDPGDPSPVWPSGASIAAAADRPTLVMALHPHCPCSRASLEELARIIYRCRDRVNVQILLFAPSAAPAGWTDTGLRSAATAMPGVNLTLDRDGFEARRFGIRTSGHALLYDVDGRLAYSGGITSARGHAGDNAGQDAVVALIEHRLPRRDRQFVFGCSLLDGGFAREAAWNP